MEKKVRTTEKMDFNMRWQSPILMTTLTIVLLALATPGWAQSLQIGEKTEITGIPWDPTALTQSQGAKLYYGEDDRQDIYEVEDLDQLSWAASVCTLVDSYQVLENPDGTISILMGSYSYYGLPACDDQAFKDQPTAGFCSGFMVGDDLIATAGHCVLSENDMLSTRFLFGFVMEDETTPVTSFDESQLYSGVELVGRQLFGDIDYAVIRTDRPITAPGATALPLRREGFIALDTLVGTIGFPAGLPMKVAFGENTRVSGISNDYYFEANIDATGGNSGGPVFNAVTGLVEGVLVYGPALRYISRGSCFEVATYPDDYFLPIRSTRSMIFEELVPEYGVREENYSLRALPTLNDSGEPVIAVKWVNPEEGLFSQATLRRSVEDFPRTLSEGEELTRGLADRYLDEDVQVGVEYYYSLFIELASGLVRIDLTRATASSNPETVEVLSEGFGPDPNTGLFSEIDLSFSQITFTPVGPPRGEIGNLPGYGLYTDYEATIVQQRVGGDPVSLPVEREDEEGGSFPLVFGEDGQIQFFMNGPEFPFFGKGYSVLYIASNGYISFEPIDDYDELNFPSVESHFALPRISFLFADLSPSTGGSYWYRNLDDRLVLTFEQVPERNLGISSVQPASNTVQLELFYSGHIRITYQELGALIAAVGISDGEGLPVDPAEAFEEVESVVDFVDFSGLDEEAMKLSINPLPLHVYDSGDMVSFQVTTQQAQGLETQPELWAEWTNTDESVPFGDQGDGTGTFAWRSDVLDSGNYTVRFYARNNDVTTYQDSYIFLGDIVLKPSAANLRLSSGTPFEDPHMSRPVDVERPLYAFYDYHHQLMLENPDTYGEGPSQLHWYKDGQLIPALTNKWSVPSQATSGDDRWHFTITPITLGYVEGDVVSSPIVTIAAYPEIESVTPAFGLIGGGTTVSIKGARLGAPLAVRFGGAPATQVRMISDTELQVLSPVYPAGPVAVSVETVDGIGQLEAGFCYVTSEEEIPSEDVNQDGKTDAIDVQIVTNAVLDDGAEKNDQYDSDTNRDGSVNAVDIQVVVNSALLR